MTSITKPKIAHPSLPRNELGLTRRDYEGAMSTLCAGCGHDSITAAIVEACWGLSLRPETLVKLSGIGCSSKTTAYFVGGAHGFNSVHGRMPSIATGANAANRELAYIGVQIFIETGSSRTPMPRTPRRDHRPAARRHPRRHRLSLVVKVRLPAIGPSS